MGAELGQPGVSWQGFWCGALYVYTAFPPGTRTQGKLQWHRAPLAAVFSTITHSQLKKKFHLRKPLIKQSKLLVLLHLNP